MAKIQELLDNLLHKKLGRDVRQSIHDSIEQCYKDATGHPESVAGVIEENKNLKQAMAKQDARINNLAKLPSGSTTGDAELADIRVGADGKTYDTAGQAVREQIGSLKSDTSRIKKSLSTTYVDMNLFALGTINKDTGKEESSNKILRSIIYVDATEDITINLPKGYQWNVASWLAGEYRSNLWNENNWNQNLTIKKTTMNYKYRILIRRSDGADITLSELISVAETNREDLQSFDKIDDLKKKLGGKVDKEDGKGLSSNDYTNSDKEKLDNLNNYDDTDVKEQIGSLKEDLTNIDDTVFNVTQEFKDCTSDATVLPDKFVCLFTGGDGTLLISINDGKDLCDCYVMPVNEGDRFQAKGVIYNDNLYYPFIIMSSASFSGNNIEQTSLVTAENGNYKYWGAGKETELYEFVIPKGVKTLLVNNFSRESEFLLKKSVDVKKSKIPTKISELENDTLFLSREMYTPQYNIYTGQIRNSGDFLPVYEVKDDGAYQVTEMIPVSKGDKIYYSGSFYSFPAVALYDKFGTFVSDLSGDLKIYVQYDNVEVKEITCDGFVAAYSYKTVDGSNAKLALNVYGNKAKNEINSNYKMNYLYVATTGNDETGDGSASNPFASIYHANNIIHSNSPRNRFTIIVKNGTYTDLQERYSGVGSSGVYQGVKTKPYVYYQSETPERPDLCVIKWNGATGLTIPCPLPDVNEKAPFHVCGELLPFCMHTKIKGFTFDCKNTRYSAHIEMAGATFENEWAFENCIFKFEGRPDITDDNNKTAPVVGIGSGFSENGIFKNCIFENLQSEYNQAINVHDNEFMPSDIAPYMLKGFTYTIDGCLFKSCNLIGLGSIHQDANNYDIDNMLYLKHCSGIDTVNANENMKYKFIDN